MEYADAKKIILFAFPPHSTHKLQPLDGAPFLQYKNHHGKAVNEQTRLGSTDFTKTDFLHSLNDIRTKTFTPRVIRSGFTSRGLYPYNPEIVLDEMRAELGSDDDSTLTFIDSDPITSSPTNQSISPPKTALKLRQRITKARKSLQEVEEVLNDFSPTLRRRLDRIFDGSLMQAELGAHRESEVENFIRLNQRKNTKKNRHQVQVGGMLTIKDANRSMNSRKVSEMKKTFLRSQREAKKRQKQIAINPPPSEENSNISEESPSQVTGDIENDLFFIDTEGWQV